MPKFIFTAQCLSVFLFFGCSYNAHNYMGVTIDKVKPVSICKIDKDFDKYQSTEVYVGGTLINGGHLRMYAVDDLCPNIEYYLSFDRYGGNEDAYNSITRALWSPYIGPDSKIVVATFLVKVPKKTGLRILHVINIQDYSITNK